MATATIKRATIFTTPDGTQHASAKAAAEHVQMTATLKALEGLVPLMPQNDDAGFPCVSATELSAWLYDNREAVLAAITTKVEVRQRKPRAKKVAEVASGAQA